jgi:hypothetical protein
MKPHPKDPPGYTELEICERLHEAYKRQIERVEKAKNSVELFRLSMAENLAFVFGICKAAQKILNADIYDSQMVKRIIKREGGIFNNIICCYPDYSDKTQTLEALNARLHALQREIEWQRKRRAKA